VELFLNGKKIGRKKPNKNGVARFKLRHEKGELMTVCYDKNGNKTGYAFLKSAGDETKLTLVAEREYVKKDGLCYIRIRYTDDKGTIKPLVRGDVKLKVSGGKLVGAGSACPYNPKGYLSDITDTYYGEALAIIRPDKSEKIVLSALSAFGSAEVIVPVK
jgi:beta-galactosidase